MGSTATTATTTATTGAGGSSQIFADAGKLFSSLSSSLQVLAVGIAVVAGIAILIQMAWASAHGDTQKRQAHITHLEWVLGATAGVFLFATALSYVTAFFGG